MAALHQLPPDVEMRARMVYYEGIRLSFIASSGFALVGFIAALYEMAGSRALLIEGC